MALLMALFVTPGGGFATEPYDDYEKLRDRLIEYIPDFRLLMKHDPRTDRLVFWLM